MSSTRFTLLSCLYLISCQAFAAAPACDGAALIAEFKLSVLAPGQKTPIALRDVHSIASGYKLLYVPGQLSAREGKHAEVALVISPVNTGGARKPEVIVLEPKPAIEAAEWEIPANVAVAALVYGPQGLDKGKVKRLVRDDSELIAQLAEYAEKTAQTETLLQQLKQASATASSPEGMEAALRGVAAPPGSGAMVNRTAPLNQQASAVLAGLNPALATYDPLVTNDSARVAQSAGLAASIARMFFNNTVGLAIGSAALAENLRVMMFPNVDFRSSFAQRSASGIQTLCAKREPHQARTKPAYLWAARIPNAPAPALKISSGGFLAQGGLGEVGIQPVKEESWAAVSDVKHWRLKPVSASGSAVDVPVVARTKSQSLRIDLAKTALQPGEYRLSGDWDWTAFEADGTLRVQPLPDLSKAALASEYRDKLVHGAGPVEIHLTGIDFEFLDAVQLLTSATDSKPLDLPFTLPKGRGGGPQETLMLTIDTAKLPAGRYKLAMMQAGAKTAAPAAKAVDPTAKPSEPVAKPYEIAIRILPPLPALKSLPLRANVGETKQALHLAGAGLDRIEAVTVDGATLTLASSAGAERRDAAIQLAPTVQAGQELDLRVKVEGMTNPLVLRGALHVAPPRPRISSATLSRSPGLGIVLQSDELAADAFVTFSMRVNHLDGQAVVRLRCSQVSATLAPQELRPGEKTSTARLDQAGAGVLFLSLLPGAVGQPGCDLQLTVETAEAGASEARDLGRVVRLPKIDKFQLTDERAGEGRYAGLLEGEHLETISAVGWDAAHPVPVEALPAPLAGDAQRQSLRIAVAWPAPAPRAPLYVWLQGEERGRLTESRF